MKFLDDEWYDEYVKRCYASFDKPGKLTLTYCELYKECGGEHDTMWIFYDFENAMFREIKRGYGEDTVPDSMYRCTGTREAFVGICDGSLDPKKAVLSGKLGLKGNMLKAFSMLDMANKLTEAKKVPGVEY